MKLLTETTAKIVKSEHNAADDILWAIMYLEPSLDYKSICSGSTEGCRKSCLTNSGMMRMATQTAARVKRTQFLIDEPFKFLGQLAKELVSLQKKAQKQGKRLAVRLNGTSDIDWSGVYNAFKDVQFYEYTKVYGKRLERLSGYSNLHLTVSRSEKMTDARLVKVVNMGYNVATVFNTGKTLPNSFMGIPVIDGDEHDARFDEGTGRIIGLRVKGTNAAKKAAIDSGFAVSLQEGELK